MRTTRSSACRCTRAAGPTTSPAPAAPPPTAPARPSPDRAVERLDLAGTCWTGVRLRAGALRRRLGHLGELFRGHAEVAQPLETAEPRELLGARSRIVR